MIQEDVADVELRLATRFESLRLPCYCLASRGVLPCRAMHGDLPGARGEWAQTTCATHCGCQGRGWLPDCTADALFETAKEHRWVYMQFEYMGASEAPWLCWLDSDNAYVGRNVGMGVSLRVALLLALDAATGDTEGRLSNGTYGL